MDIVYRKVPSHKQANNNNFASKNVLSCVYDFIYGEGVLLILLFAIGSM